MGSVLAPGSRSNAASNYDAVGLSWQRAIVVKITSTVTAAIAIAMYATVWRRDGFFAWDVDTLAVGRYCSRLSYGSDCLSAWLQKWHQLMEGLIYWRRRALFRVRLSGWWCQQARRNSARWMKRKLRLYEQCLEECSSFVAWVKTGSELDLNDWAGLYQFLNETLKFLKTSSCFIRYWERLGFSCLLC